MLGVITDGLWSPPSGAPAAAPASLGGATGGTPARPELSIPRPQVSLHALRPAIRAAMLAGIQAIIHPELQPQVSAHEVRPTPPEES